MKMIPNHPVALMALLLVATSAVWAQSIFRSVDANGRITYSDKPPAAAATPERSSAVSGTNSADDNTAALPYLLRQVATAFPVTLYTGPSCGEPCSAGRSLLVGRGIPFTEKTISTQADIEALQRIAGEAGLPLLTIGGQYLRGYSEASWNQYLSIADYPTSSQLPPNFHNAPATPLTSRTSKPQSQTPVIEASPAIAAPPPGPTPGNPAGIQF
jgi:glutaredoxin